MNNRFKPQIVSGLAVLMFGVFLILLLRPVPTNSPPVDIPKASFQPSPFVGNNLPAYIIELPKTDNQVNTDSPAFEVSKNEIDNLKPFLPYEKNLRLSTGLDVSLLISQITSQPTPWMLKIEVFGIDYRISPQDQDYQMMKKSFKEALASASTWIRLKGVNPDNLIVSWGDKAFIQDKADQWLKEL